MTSNFALISADLLARLSEFDHGILHIRDVSESAQPIIALGVGNRARPVFFVVPDDAHASRSAELFRAYRSLCNQKIPLFQASSSGSSGSAIEDMIWINRLRDYRHGIYMVTPQATWSLGALMAQPTITYRQHQQAGVGQLIRDLEAFGYVAEQTLVKPGQYRRLGGHVDIFMPERSRPVRIEFFGDDIDRISVIDRVSHELVSEMDVITISSLRFDTTALEKHQHDRSSIHALILADGKSSSSFVFATRECYEDVVEGFDERERELFFTHPIVVMDEFLPESLSANPVPMPVSVHELSAGYADVRRPSPLPKPTVALNAIDDNTTVIVASNRATELESARPDIDVLVPYSHAARVSGFVHNGLGVTLLTDRDLFTPRRKPKAVASKGKRDHALFVSELSPGDYVVHLDHGIGLFSGIESKEIGGIRREYFVIEYAGGDKIFLPVDMADKIDRYVGAKHPTLHRLATAQWHQQKRRAKHESQQVAAQLLKLYAQREVSRGFSYLTHVEFERALADSFPYDLTAGQHQALSDILADMERDTPMDRLLCGDVGFGKTELAIRSAFRAVLNHKQVAVLCPTTILAQQHTDTFRTRLDQFGLRVAMLSRFQTKAEQAVVLEDLRAGKIDIVIGTHRLLSKDVALDRLGFIIIDEEQRFGVLHKERLKELRVNVDVLTLTATPIPRTLQFSLAGIRDMSHIDTPPLGRLAVDTQVIPYRTDTIKEEISRAVRERDQVYFLHNRVETIYAKRHELERLVPEARIGVAHGQMDEKELMAVMHQFDQRELDVLVCTTIIENGLDLPNVNTLLVNNAPMFGLAQLYQIRGRIGRGTKQARAFFFYKSRTLTGKAKERLAALLRAKELGSGLTVASMDLDIRGAGNILGTEQSGQMSTVGLYLYSQLLQQSIEEIKHEQPAQTTIDVSVELPVEAYIPAHIATEDEKRFQLYQRIARQESIEALHTLRDRIMKDASGGAGELAPLDHLFAIHEVKMLARQARVFSIHMQSIHRSRGTAKRLVMDFADDINADAFISLLKQEPGWRKTDRSIKRDIDDESLLTADAILHEVRRTLALFVA
jgi:transcription-repair coupling factor